MADHIGYHVRFGHEQIVSGASRCLRTCLIEDNCEYGYSTAIASGVKKNSSYEMRVNELTQVNW